MGLESTKVTEIIPLELTRGQEKKNCNVLTQLICGYSRDSIVKGETDSTLDV